MKIEKANQTYDVSLQHLEMGKVYAAMKDDVEVYLLKTDEYGEVVQLDSGILWRQTNWIGKGVKFREVNAKVVIE